MGSKKRPWWSARRLLQLVTGLHRIHHLRFAYGYKLPFVGWAYFPPWTARDGTDRPTRYVYGWQRVDRRHFHDCTRTGVY